MIGALISILIWGIIIVIIALITFWAMDRLQVGDPQIKKIVGAIFLLIFLIIVASCLFGYGPLLIVNPRPVMVP